MAFSSARAFRTRTTLIKLRSGVPERLFEGDIFDEALARIKESLGEMSEAEIEALWLEEATRRAREAREGLVEDIPLEQALRDARTQLD